MIEYRKIQISNIGPFQSATYRFNVRSKTLICGVNKKSGMSRNGAGKSMIFDILTWVLWEKTVRDISKDKMLRSGQDQGYARVFIEKELWEYRITRFRGKNNSLHFDRFDLKTGEKDKDFSGTGRNTSITQSNIEKHFGSFTTFIVTSYFGQGASNKYLDGTSSERVDVVTQFFGIGIWDKVKSAVKVERNNLKSLVSRSEAEVDILAEQLESFDYGKQSEEKRLEYSKYKKARSEAKRIQNEIKRATDTVELGKRKERLMNDKASLVTNFDTQIRLVNDRIEDKKESIDKLDSLKRKVASIPEKEQKEASQKEYISDLEKTRDSLIKEKTTAVNTASGYENRVVELRELIDNIGEGQCPTCDQIVPKSHIDKIKKNIKISEGSIHRWKVKANEIAAGIKEVTEELEKKRGELERLQHTLRVAKIAKRELESALKSKDEVKELENDKKRLKRNLDDKLKAIDGLVAEVNKVLRGRKSYLPGDIKTLERDFEIVTNDATIHYGNYKSIKNDLSQYRSNERKLKELKGESKEKQNDLDLYEYIYMSIPIIKLMIIDTVNVLLEKKFNEKLKEFGITVTIELDTEIDKKSSEGKIDKYEILIVEEGQDPRDYKSYSGGEKQRLALAIYTGIQEVADLMLSEDQIPNIVLFDEVFSSLDEVGRATCLDIFQSFIDKSRRNVHCITHLEEIEKTFKVDERIIVTKDEEGVSKIVGGGNGKHGEEY